MSKHDDWLKNRESIKRSNEFEAFSFPIFLMKLVICLNVLLSIVMISDFFLTPTKESTTIHIYSGEAEITYQDIYYESITLDHDVKKEIINNSRINLYFTPIFHIRKYFTGYNKNSQPYKNNSYAVLLPAMMILLNLASFITSVVFPYLNDRLFEEDYNWNTFYYKSSSVDMLLVAPFFLSLIYWYKLYHFLF